MNKIELGNGNYTLVDDEDYDYLNRWKWYESWNHYVVRGEYNGGNYKTIRMHRVIMNTPKGLVTDHINRDTLDNRRSNLRICNKSINGLNRGPQKNNTTGFKGVTFEKQTRKYVARISINRLNVTLGRFKTPEEASKAYQDYLKANL